MNRSAKPQTLTDKLADALRGVLPLMFEADGDNAPLAQHCDSVLEEYDEHAKITPRAVVTLEGGLVQGLLCEVPVRFLVIDYDTEGADDDEVTAIPQDDGGTADACCRTEPALIDPDFIGKAFAAVGEPGPGTQSEADAALMDCIVGMRRDVEPLVRAATKFLVAPHQGSGVKAMAEVTAARAALEAALKPFAGRESEVLADAGTQAPAESVQAAVTAGVELADEVITTTLRLSDEFCADVLCTAFEGGTGYWAALDKIERTERDAKGDWRYVRAEMSDTEAMADDEPAFAPFTCDYALIRKGIAKALGANPGIGTALVAAIQSGATQNDAGHIDADAADAIVQLGAFGELTFG